ncbi:unnamed protein product [Diatraea saccharalis]|uniref:Gamma-butyrobetaine dioxygenase n=1 Tax=Diatraea saccharalis TaxID=40085 RepID=A0A9N9RH69_9NEOP|nr:unnamed protein product [Diatraea saccharalis]
MSLRILFINLCAAQHSITRAVTIMYVIKQLVTNRLPRIHNVSLERFLHDYLKVEIAGDNLKFPHVWLRDNCQCEQCFHSSAKSRIFDWSKFDLDIKPKGVLRKENTIEITWSDDHRSVYKLDWLKFRSFTRENRLKYDEAIYRPTQKTWSKETFNGILKRFEYKEILESDSILYDWLYNLSVYGVTLIQNTPNSENAIDDVIARVAFPKTTHYGVKFVVQSVQDTSNVAYLSGNLPLHLDLPYYEYCPGTTLLHCLVQTESYGGENLLSDSFYVAKYMRKHHPDQFKILAEVEVEWSDIGVEAGNEFFKLYRAPVFCMDKHNKLYRVNFSIPQRGSYFPEPIEKVIPWYYAHKMFLNLSNQFSASFKTKIGDILVFNNTRMLHGRSAYEDSNNNVRRLIGAYIDWDEIYSRLRCLIVKSKKVDGV